MQQPIGNLATKLPRTKRGGDAMRRYDALPAPLRRWMAQAALPWSPASCLQIWRRAKAKGATVQQRLDRLSRAEAAMLEKEGNALKLKAS